MSKRGDGSHFVVDLPTDARPTLVVTLEGGSWLPEERARMEADMGERVVKFLRALAEAEGGTFEVQSVRIGVPAEEVSRP